MVRELRGKTILVTGVTGFIGSHVAERLLREGCAVRGLVRNLEKAKPLEAKGMQIVRGDMTDRASLINAVKNTEIIFHFAGILADEYRSWSYYRKVNVDGTKILADAAIESGIELFIHTSTAWVYGKDAVGIINEQSPKIFSGTRYCDTKLEAENIIRGLNKNLPVIIVQPTDVYGPGDETYTLGPLRMIKSGTMILPGKGKGLINAIYIDDLVEGIILAAKTGKTGDEYLLGAKEQVTAAEFFGALAGTIGRPTAFPFIPTTLALFAASIAEIFSSVTGIQPIFTKEAVYAVLMRAEFDAGKAYSELGFKPKTDLKKGMALVAEWIKSKNI